MTKSTKMLSINQDSFIYAVHQAYEARQLRPGGENFNSHLRYEPFLAGTFQVPEVHDFASFKNMLSKIIMHHWNVLPHYQRKELVTLENISWFAHSVAALLADMDYLFRSYTGTELPLLPIQSKENQEKSEAITKEVWNQFIAQARKIFGPYFELISVYIAWKYTPQEQETISVDWNVRPPCGAAYRKEFKEYLDAERDEKRAQFNAKKRDNTRDRDHKERPQREHAPKHEKHEKHEAASAQHSRHHSEVTKPTEQAEINSNPKFVKRDRSAPRQKASFAKKNDFDIEQYKQKNLDEALMEAKQAVQKFLDNPDMAEINLKPQNSFIRRQQHVVLADAGFDTESRGETAHRHVCAKRKN